MNANANARDSVNESGWNWKSQQMGDFDLFNLLPKETGLEPEK